MKTTYWLVTAAAVAAAGVVVYLRMTAEGPPLPKVPVTADAGRPEVPQLPLPPVVLPPDDAPVIPAAPDALPVVPLVPDAPPITLASGTEPLVPLVPVVPVPVPVPGRAAPPAVPVLPTPPMLPTPPAPSTAEPPLVPILPPAPKPVIPPAPAKPEVPLSPTKVEVPLPPVVPPAKPAEPSAVPVLSVPPAPPAIPAPPVPVPPAPPTPVLLPPVPAKPNALPATVTDTTAHEPLAVAGKYVVLKDDKLIEGAVTVSGDTVLVRQGALDRPFTKSQVQYVAASRDEVYKFMLAKVSAGDAAARLKVAKWCMFSGLREQALVEAREVQKLQPNATAAADMIRSLELSLQQFPPEGAAKMTAPAAPTFPVELVPVPAKPVAPVEPEPDVSPEAALVFGARVQPFLANKCVECHAKPDHTGAFKLVRVNPTDAGPQATRTNLRAVAGQLRKDDPAASPLLLKSLAAHGGMKLPAVAGRQTVAYQSLEAWTALAVGTPLAVPPAPAPAVPALPVPVADPLPLPPAAPVADPLLPPALPVPAPLPKPAVPPIPPADPLVPAIPPIPPAASAPKVPSPVVPASGSQFGAVAPPKPPVTGPTGGDEFDPKGFNPPK